MTSTELAEFDQVDQEIATLYPAVQQSIREDGAHLYTYDGRTVQGWIAKGPGGDIYTGLECNVSLVDASIHHRISAPNPSGVATSIAHLLGLDKK